MFPGLLQESLAVEAADSIGEKVIEDIYGLRVFDQQLPAYEPVAEKKVCPRVVAKVPAKLRQAYFIAENKLGIFFFQDFQHFLDFLQKALGIFHGEGLCIEILPAHLPRGSLGLIRNLELQIFDGLLHEFRIGLAQFSGHADKALVIDPAGALGDVLFDDGTDFPAGNTEIDFPVF